MLLLTEKEKQEKYQRNMPNRWKDEPNKHWKNQKEIRECAAQEIVRLNEKIKRFNNYNPTIKNMSLKQRKYRIQIEQMKEVNKIIIK